MTWEQIWTTVVNSVVGFMSAFGIKLVAALLVLFCALPADFAFFH